MTLDQQIKNHLIYLYGDQAGEQTWAELSSRLDSFCEKYPSLTSDSTLPNDLLSERDAILITYGDQFNRPSQLPLATLCDFLEAHLRGSISAVHILPFYPFSSDDGFSVIDYTAVDPQLGTWEDLARLGENFQLMYDAVLNHISRQSSWFHGFLASRAPYTGYFITVDPQTDLSMVVRPRSLPLLTPVETPQGEQFVWTTFSADQIDLNYANPKVLLEILDVLLFYVGHGARFIRLDAIAYLWKEIGTPCIHLPQTHRVVKLMRAVIDKVAPGVVLITETNVPHEENISYFGQPRGDDGHFDEAQMVYQFPLAPLVLHTFQTGNAQCLTHWAAGLSAPGPDTTFFNFIASHDGIGVMPAKGLLTETEIHALVERTLKHGGEVSYKVNSDGSQSVYELNITLFDALNDPHNPDPDRDVARFIASQAVLLSLAGVPGIYVHSLFGSRNCHSCMDETGRARSLNREKFSLVELEIELSEPDSLKHRVFQAYRHVLQQRRSRPAFHPRGAQKVLTLGDPFFAVVRTAPEGDDTILSIVNISPTHQTVSLNLVEHSLPSNSTWIDLLQSTKYSISDARLDMSLAPYQVVWLSPIPL